MHPKSFTLRRFVPLTGLLLASLLLLVAVLLAVGQNAGASSHREAPLISKDPFADNTDTYVFVSPNDPNRLVLVASWIPFEGPEGGPNYYEWDDRVYYDIYLDMNGDATADVTYTLSSKVVVNNPNTFLYNTGPIDSLTDGDWNRTQVYTVTEYFTPGMQPAANSRRVDAHITDIVANKPVAPSHIGTKSTPDYSALEQASITHYTDPDNGDKIDVFAGQTDDPFFVDLQVFDLLTLRGQNPPIGYSKENNIPVDSLSGFNVHSLVIEVPISRVTRNGDPVVGVWSGSRRQGMNIAKANAAADYVQVSRLGMPLVNEVVLPMGLKDTFNSIPPSADLTVYNLLQKSVEDPEVGNLLCGLYGVKLPGDTDNDCKTEFTPGSPRTGRGDIFDIFLTGMVLENPFTITKKDGSKMELPKGFNINRPNNPNITSPVPGVTPAEMIRINTGISGELCAPTPSRLGILGGDACGFPNGRRLTDDTVEIALLAVAGAAYPVLDARDANFSFDAGLIGVLTDGIDANDKPFRNTFPYVAQAQSGQSHLHTNPILGVFLPLLQKAMNSVQNAGVATSASVPAALLLLVTLPALWWAGRREK
ncbi:MAG: DUF4331 domain-containing protein [Caldilineae bacterium]|nr:MAG: DUF4331 domain-containing protein [Caldilineae bacterium]